MNDWEKDTYWQYEKLKDDGKVEIIGINKNDFDGKITGKNVFGVKEYFDENPNEARRLGWIKHIHHNVDKWVQYNEQTQYLTKQIKTIDPYTVEDVYHVFDKTEEMMRRSEEQSSAGIWGWSDDDVLTFGG